MGCEISTVPEAVVRYWDDAYNGPGWYYYDASYPRDGSVGAFDTAEDASQHAQEAGFLVRQ